MQVRRRDSSRASHLADYVPLLYLLSFVDLVDAVMGVHRGKSPRMADDDEIAIAAQLIAVQNLTLLNGSNRRPLRSLDIYSIMEGRAARSEFRAYAPLDRPDEAFGAYPPLVRREAGFEYGRRRCDDFHGELPCRSGDEDPLAGSDLTRVRNSVDPGQFLVRDIVSLPDTK